MSERITSQEILRTIEEHSSGSVSVTMLALHLGIPRERLSSFLRVLQMFDHIKIIDNELIELTAGRRG